MSDEQAPDNPPPSVTDDAFAASLRGFGPTGIIAILVILFAGNYAYIPFGALMVLLWVRRSHTPWRAIGYVLPGSWILTVLAGITLPRNYGAEYIRSFDTIYTSLAKQYKLVLIPFLLLGVAQSGPGLMQQDSIHPTAAGNEKVAATVFRYLAPVLKK